MIEQSYVLTIDSVQASADHAQFTPSFSSLFAQKPAREQVNDQAWYWSRAWQLAESAAEADLEENRYQDFTSIDDFLASL